MTDTKVIHNWTYIGGSGATEFMLSSINPITTKVKQGEYSLVNIGWFFLTILFIATLLELPSKPSLVISSSVLLIASICFLLYFLKKEETEIFLNKNNEVLFWIRLTKRGDEKIFIEKLKEKIQNNVFV